MPRATKLAARSCAIVLALVLCGVGAAADAQGRSLRVAVGAVGSEGLSDALTEAIETHPGVDLAPVPRAEVVLRGSIVRWERHRVANQTEVRCEVSVIVADARGGSIRAMLRGRGGARGGGSAERLSHDALRAAVRGALRPLGGSSRARLARAG